MATYAVAASSASKQPTDSGKHQMSSRHRWLQLQQTLLMKHIPLISVHYHLIPNHRQSSHRLPTDVKDSNLIQGLWFTMISRQIQCNEPVITLQPSLCQIPLLGPFAYQNIIQCSESYWLPAQQHVMRFMTSLKRRRRQRSIHTWNLIAKVFQHSVESSRWKILHGPHLCQISAKRCLRCLLQSLERCLDQSMLIYIIFKCNALYIRSFTNSCN